MVKRMRPLLVAVGVVTLLVSLALFGVLPTAATAATASGFSEPFTPAAIAVNKPFTVTGFVDKAAATGPIKLLFYQNIRGSWVLQKTEYARWSGYTDTVTKYLADVTVPYEGTWRIGASYGGNEAYASEYKYRDLQVGAKLNANATGPMVPYWLVKDKPFTVTGFVDKAAATGPIKLLFYQNIRGSWVLQKTEYARWSGYTDTVTKYLADVTVPYEGTWRIGASYGGNEIYLSSYGYRDMTVNARNTSGVTRIVVDKSDFRLYLLRNDDLIVSYPVATGRPSMETPARMWKVGAKYYTDPASVYGPRKMRLYRKTSSGYEYTTYLIHGTNEPWVIGTKASHGCVRMYNADVLTLFPQVPLGALVETRE